MGRSIVTSTPAAENPGARSGPGSEFKPASSVDTYSDALLKLIPAEVIGVYLSMLAILNGAEDKSAYAPLVVFLFGVFATWFYLRYTLQVVNKIQLLLSVGAFCVWAYSMSKGLISWYDSTNAGLLLIAYTFIAPKILMAVKS